MDQLDRAPTLSTRSFDRDDRSDRWRPGVGRGFHWRDRLESQILPSLVIEFRSTPSCPMPRSRWRMSSITCKRREPRRDLFIFRAGARGVCVECRHDSSIGKKGGPLVPGEWPMESSDRFTPALAPLPPTRTARHAGSCAALLGVVQVFFPSLFIFRVVFVVFELVVVFVFYAV
jgi:hypothetical protein